MENSITVYKNDLINKILENKAKHLLDYGKAVIAFKAEALKQLNELTNKINNGDINKIHLNLVKPVNVSTRYDEIIEMINWDIHETIKLTKNDYDKYVLDKDNHIITANFANQTYLSTTNNF